LEEIQIHKKNKFQSSLTPTNFEDQKQQWITRISQMGLENKDLKRIMDFAIKSSLGRIERLIPQDDNIPYCMFFGYKDLNTKCHGLHERQNVKGY
jgi:hypothetical protein